LAPEHRQPRICATHWTRSGANVLLGRLAPPGRRQSIANRLILIGTQASQCAAASSLARFGQFEGGQELRGGGAEFEWLAQAGFTPQSRIRVRVMMGCLVITTE